MKVLLNNRNLFFFQGGSGFLGQHVIRVIQERGDGVQEIRVVDVLPYKKKLGKFQNH